jgi:cytochrome oxidase Cu insertion factor (SCO1/SenC/PrrC family)
MSRKSIITALVISMFLVSVIPTANAYKGYQLSRGPVDDFTLTNQDNELMNLTDFRGDVVVVAFIFTKCPDVCPIITQLLRSVDEGLTSEYQEHVSIISISVDPEYDTPEMLKDYTELHGVNWPHLTGDPVEMEPIWSSFGLVVQKNVIDAHLGEINGHQAEDSTLMFVNKSGVATELMNTPTAWSTTKFAAAEADWELNYSTHPDFGTMLSGIEGVEAPDDYSWWWKLMTYNKTSEGWEDSMLGVDSVEYPLSKNVAWVASNADDSLLNAPDLDNSSVSVIFPDNTTAHQQITNNNGWHLTSSAFDGAGISFSAPDSQWGHYLESVADEDPADDNYSWWWELHEWNETAMTWEASSVGMDSIENPSYLAWAPNSTEDSTIPMPGVFVEDDDVVCDGYGWEMGSGAGKHCMCDDGYEWPEDTMLSCVLADVEEEYYVGHSTTTLILDTQRKPVIAWTGDSWQPEEFIEDIEALVQDEGLVDVESSGIPGFIAAIGVAAISLAAIRISRNSNDNDQ